ncbi:glycosyltransferase family 4 protein [Pedobacter sp. SL55]|uniref:glycosyltransferase family 4 protein n=1 Tax=Pedobacter sp. SL55 TaxID=2995161 RepID=UPI00226F0202|nr:glycosyltransferase family 4 protein [Pedobacter sp. SL55]WAC39061.1 glycosyltransferase family 4 protein [Pedobacter sp. SL55]
MNLLFLTLKTFSFTGGIEKACRSLMYAISQQERMSLSTWSMYDATADCDHKYAAQSIFKGFSGSRISFALAVLRNAFKFDKVVLSHINLLLFGKLINIIKPSTQIILWAHGIEVWRTIPNWKKKFLQEKAEIWAVSNYTKQQLIERHQIPSANIKVLHNTLDPFYKIPSNFTKPSNLLDQYQIKPDAFVLFTLTRLSATEHAKNYDLAINAVKALKAQFPQLVYIIGGKADEQEQMRLSQLIAKHQLSDEVKIIGFIEEKEIEAHYRLADCFVLPSKKEGFGIVLIEAAAHGCQVIAGNIDGSTDALLNGKLGQLVNPDSEEEIIKAIQQALNNPAHEPKAQQALTVKQFGFDRYVEKVGALLK